MVKESVYSRKVGDIDDLKARIQATQSIISRETCIRAINVIGKRWFLCVEHDGEQVDAV